MMEEIRLAIDNGCFQEYKKKKLEGFQINDRKKGK
jgi:queuine/archaeosine tRNA-ribosyltransferase